MQVSLSIVRYRKRYIPFALLAMLVFRLPLWLNNGISFYKLLGCSRSGTFDKRADLQQWGILTVLSPGVDNGSLIKELYGGFIAGWLSFFGCEVWTILLEPVEGHGSWDGKKVFGNLLKNSTYHGPVAILTRATIRFTKLKYFWQNVPPVAQKMKSAKGLIASFGIGEIPRLKQGTFSIWETIEDMKAFAYGVKEHTAVIKRTKEQQWYSEEMFIRFKITETIGTIRGINPVEGKSYI